MFGHFWSRVGRQRVSPSVKYLVHQFGPAWDISTTTEGMNSDEIIVIQGFCGMQFSSSATSRLTLVVQMKCLGKKNIWCTLCYFASQNTSRLKNWIKFNWKPRYYEDAQVACNNCSNSISLTWFRVPCLNLIIETLSEQRCYVNLDIEMACTVLTWTSFQLLILQLIFTAKVVFSFMKGSSFIRDS